MKQLTQVLGEPLMKISATRACTGITRTFGSGRFRLALTALLLVGLGSAATATAGAAMSVQVVLTSFTDNDASGNVTRGDQLFYTTTATNTGSVPLTNVQVNNSVGTLGSNCNLAPNATCVLTNSYVVQPADATAGFVQNTGRATSTEVPGPVTNVLNTPVFTSGGHLSGTTVLTSYADNDNSGTVTVGDVLTITITARNDGSITLTNVQITDPLLTPNLATCASVVVGATCTLTGTHLVTASDAANGQIFNKPRATTNETGNNGLDSGLITPVATASGAAMSVIDNINNYVDVDNSGTTTAGDRFQVIVTATNTGRIPLTNVQVTNPQTVPSSTTCASVAVGANCVLTGTYTITAADITNMIITITGSATSTQVPGPVTFSQNIDIRGTNPIVEASMLKVAGDAQSGAPGMALPIPLKIRLLGLTGAGVPGRQISFIVGVGSASLSTVTTTTDALGEASTQVTLGSTPGPVEIFVTGKDAPNVLFTEFVTGTAVPGGLTIVSGDSQVLVGTTPSQPLVVQLKSVSNVPVVGATINWSATNGTLASATSLTDVAGRASNTVSATTPGSAVTVQASSVLAAAPVTFNLNTSLVNNPNLTPQERAVATVIDIACPALASQDTLTPEQADLLARCREITAAAGINGGATADALGQLVTQSAEVQSNAAVTAAVAQFQNINLRLTALRSSSNTSSLSSNTSSLSGLSFAGPGGVLPLGSLMGALLNENDKQNAGKQAGAGFSRWGFFATGTIGRGTADARSTTPGYNYDINGLTAGVDYRQRDNWVYGAAVGFSRQTTNVEQDRGRVSLTGWSISSYSTWSFKNNLYVDGVVTWGSNRFDMNRRIDYTLPLPGGGTTSIHQIASGQPGGDLFSAALTFGGDFHKEAWNFSPYAQLISSRMGFDSYREKLQAGPGNGLGLAVDARTVTTLSSVLGAKVSWTHSVDWGVFIPTASFEWQHEYKSDLQAITAHFISDPTQTSFSLTGVPLDNNFFRVGAGFSVVMSHGRSGFALFEHQLGRSGMSQDNLGFGIRIEF